MGAQRLMRAAGSPSGLSDGHLRPGVDQQEQPEDQHSQESSADGRLHAGGDVLPLREELLPPLVFAEAEQVFHDAFPLPKPMLLVSAGTAPSLVGAEGLEPSTARL